MRDFPSPIAVVIGLFGLRICVALVTWWQDVPAAPFDHVGTLAFYYVEDHLEGLFEHIVRRILDRCAAVD